MLASRLSQSLRAGLRRSEIARCSHGAVVLYPRSLATKASAQEAAVEINPRKEGLALLLDDGTRKSHSVAENTSFVSGFFRGLASRDSFSQLVASLYFVYAAMERVIEESPSSAVRALDFPALRRMPALERDMAFWFGPDFADTVKPSPATARYVRHIEALSESDLIVAHQYTRYLGDLFGGVMMGGMARTSLSLEDGRGIEFYTFPEIPDAKEFITEWYTQLNALELTQTEKDAIVDEANAVFGLNILLLEELEGNPWSTALKLLWTDIRKRLGMQQ